MTEWWEQAYRDDELPWETGRPQPAIVALLDSNGIDGPVLDSGCGIGTEALYLAEHGYDVTGIDIAETAVDRARSRATSRSGLDNVAFQTADVLELAESELGPFETVLDCGLFHALQPCDRTRYAASLDSVVADGGRVILLAFGPEAPADWPPHVISQADIRDTFTDGWEIDSVEPAPFETTHKTVEGILGIIRKLADPL